MIVIESIKPSDTSFKVNGKNGHNGSGDVVSIQELVPDAKASNGHSHLINTQEIFHSPAPTSYASRAYKEKTQAAYPSETIVFRNNRKPESAVKIRTAISQKILRQGYFEITGRRKQREDRKAHGLFLNVEEIVEGLEKANTEEGLFSLAEQETLEYMTAEGIRSVYVIGQHDFDTENKRITALRLLQKYYKGKVDQLEEKFAMFGRGATTRKDYYKNLEENLGYLLAVRNELNLRNGKNGKKGT